MEIRFRLWECLEPRGQFLDASTRRIDLTSLLERGSGFINRTILYGCAGALQTAFGLSSPHPEFEVLPLRRRNVRNRSIADWHTQVRHSRVSCKRCATAEFQICEDKPRQSWMWMREGY
jgi:hypothetical protein